MFDKDKLAEFKVAEQAYREKLDAQLKKRPERQAEFKTDSGIEINSLYTPESIADLDYAKDLGLPGSYPYTRGVQPNMYRGRLWTMRQYAGFGSAEETNKRFRYLLGQGQTGLSVAFDLPTQIEIGRASCRERV